MRHPSSAVLCTEQHKRKGFRIQILFDNVRDWTRFHKGTLFWVYGAREKNETIIMLVKKKISTHKKEVQKRVQS